MATRKWNVGNILDLLIFFKLHLYKFAALQNNSMFLAPN